MKFPYWRCMHCEVDIAEEKLPLTPSTVVPECPNCHRTKAVDLVLGNEDTILDPNTVLFVTEG